MMNNKTKKLTLLGMFAAIAYVVMAVGRFPITSMDFLKYDPKDAVLALCGFIAGPGEALLVTVLVSLIEMLTVSSSGIIGFGMNVLASAFFVLPAAFLYRRRHSFAAALTGLLIGVLAMTGIMLLWNYLITPLYMGISRESVAAMLPTVFLPFNLVKGGLNAALTLLIYKPVITALRRARFLPEHAGKSGRRLTVPSVLIGASLLVGCVLAVLAMRGIL